ncbi:MAG: 1-acyl-sn-glycerol-3-phosphate acyltransferase [Eggerthellaceae bacterium]|nr:1-acyl-sn-glycerol-3-phosphate acyltransferase [Eggerthellaceae bacterium]
MSLLLPYKEMWERPLGGLSRDKELPHWGGNLIYGLLFVVCKVCFRYRVDGIANLRGFYRRRGVVVISNHTSFLDTIFLYAAGRPKQWIRLMGRENLFSNMHGLAGQVISRIGAFPVKRDSADLTAIKRASRMLGNCEVVGVFPEGTRRAKGSKVPELHSGAAFIARMGKAPLLPTTVRNAEHIKQKGSPLRFPKVSVEFGEPVEVSDFDFLPKEERLDACTWYAMRACFALSQRCAPEEVDMGGLYPDSRDYTEVFKAHPVPRHTAAQSAGQNGRPQQGASGDGLS